MDCDTVAVVSHEMQARRESAWHDTCMNIRIWCIAVCSTSSDRTARVRVCVRTGANNTAEQHAPNGTGHIVRYGTVRYGTTSIVLYWFGKDAR